MEQRNKYDQKRTFQNKSPNFLNETKNGKKNLNKHQNMKTAPLNELCNQYLDDIWPSNKVANKYLIKQVISIMNIPELTS